MKSKTYQQKLEESARLGEELMAAARLAVARYRTLGTNIDEFEEALARLQELVGINRQDGNDG